MKKMFLAIALLVVAPSFVAAEEVTTAPANEVPATEAKGYFATAKAKVANGVNYVSEKTSSAANYVGAKAVAASDFVESTGSKIPGSSYVSNYVFAPMKNWSKVSAVVLVAVTAAVVSSLDNNSEAEF